MCGALGGMVTSLVTDGLKCYGGEADRCSAKTLLANAAIGGITGAAFGGLVPGGNAIGTSILSRSMGASKTFVKNQFIQAPKQLARTGGFVMGSLRNIGKDAAAGGGTKAVLKETLGWAWKESKGVENYIGTAIGAFAPTTRDDWIGLRENGIDPHPINTPLQAAGAFFGGMWP